MSAGMAWEHEVANYLRSKGFHARVRKTVGNHEIDVYATHGNETLVVECKDWETNITKNPVRTVHNNAVELGAKPGLAYTSGLTTGARKLAEDYNVMLFPVDIVRGEGFTIKDLRQTVRDHSICLPDVADLSKLDDPIGPFFPDPRFADKVGDEARNRSFEVNKQDADRIADLVQLRIKEHEDAQCVPVLLANRGRIELYFIIDTPHEALPDRVLKESLSLDLRSSG